MGGGSPHKLQLPADSREYVKTRRSLGRPSSGRTGAASRACVEAAARSRTRLLHFDFSTRGWLPLKTPGTSRLTCYYYPDQSTRGQCVSAWHTQELFLTVKANRLHALSRDAMRATRSAVGTSQHAAKPRYVCSMYQTVITTEYAQQSPTILDTDVPATTALGHVRGSRTDPSGALSRRESRRGRHRPLRAGCDGGR